MPSSLRIEKPDLVGNERPVPALNLAELVDETSVFCDQLAAERDQTGSFPGAEFDRLHRDGFLSAPLGAEQGGFGLGYVSATLPALLGILTKLGFASLPVGRLYEGHVNAWQLIQTFGSLAAVQRFAQDARAGKIFGVWNAEGSRPVHLIEVGSGHYRLEGTKTFCSGAGALLRPIVPARLANGEVQMCIVPMEKATTKIDLESWPVTAMRSTVSRSIDFTGVQILPEDLIGNPGDYLRQPWLTAGVIRFSAVQTGGAERLLRLTKEYLKKIGRASDPVQVARVAKMVIAVETCSLWLERFSQMLLNYSKIFAGRSTPSEEESEMLVANGSLVRVAVEDCCLQVLEMSERCVGARGMIPPFAAERFIRDLRFYLRQPAPDAAVAAAGDHYLNRVEDH